jgi:hypothetical protein
MYSTQGRLFERGAKVCLALETPFATARRRSLIVGDRQTKAVREVDFQPPGNDGELTILASLPIDAENW